VIPSGIAHPVVADTRDNMWVVYAKSTIGTYGHTSLQVFDMLGREVATLVNERKQPGTYSVIWDAKNVAGGVYFCRLTSGAFHETRRMVLLK
jgi:hypothetical protein